MEKSDKPNAPAATKRRKPEPTKDQLAAQQALKREADLVTEIAVNATVNQAEDTGEKIGKTERSDLKELAAREVAPKFKPLPSMTVEALANERVEQLMAEVMEEVPEQHMFTSPYPELTIYVTTGRELPGANGTVVVEKKPVQFRSGTFITEDAAIAGSLRANSAFGTLFREQTSMQEVQLRRACEQVLIGHRMVKGATSSQDGDATNSRKLAAEVHRMIGERHVQ